MPSKGVTLKLRGYTLVESIVAIVILTMSLMLSTQLINTPLLGRSHYTIVDLEYVTDSLSRIPKELLINDMVINRPWGVCTTKTYPLEGTQTLMVLEINAITNLGFNFQARKEVYEVSW